MKRWTKRALAVALAMTLVLCGAQAAVSEKVQTLEAQTYDEPTEPETVQEPDQESEPEPDPDPDPTPLPTPEPTPKPKDPPEIKPELEEQVEPEKKPKAKSIEDPSRIITGEVSVGELGNVLKEMGVTDLTLIEQLKIGSGTLGKDDFDTIREMNNLEALYLADAALYGDMLPDGALKGMKRLREVRLPAPSSSDKHRSRAAEIGKSAFEGCVELRTVSGTDAVWKMGERAFSGCSRLSKIHFSSRLFSVPDGAFQGCERLPSIELGGASSIGDDAFNGCSALSSLSMASIEKIGARAFKNCVGLNSVRLTDKNTTRIGEEAFLGCRALETVTLSHTTSIGARAFEGLAKLTKISLSRAKTLGDGAFRDCKRLENVTWPQSGFDSAGSDCFDGCMLDFSKGFPGGLSASKTGWQRPRVYFELERSSGWVYVGDKFTSPGYTLRTSKGVSYKSIIGKNWVDPSVKLPRISKRPSSIDTSEPGTITITYSISEELPANTYKQTYKLTIREEAEPTPSPTPKPTPSPTPPPVEPFEDYQQAWAVLDGLSLGEVEAALDRALFDRALRLEVVDCGAQTLVPIDFEQITEEGETIPLIAAGYQLGELLIERVMSGKDRSIRFSALMADDVFLDDVTLQVVQEPEMIDLIKAQRPRDLTIRDRQFYPLDEQLSLSGEALIYLNAEVLFDPLTQQMRLLDVERHRAQLELLSHWRDDVW